MTTPHDAPIPLWIVQTNMGSGSDIQSYVQAIRASGANVAEVDIIPFSGALPDIEHDGPVVVYGAVSFVSDAQKSGRWSPGVFAAPEVFTYEKWTEHYGDLLLNDSASTTRTTIGAFAESGLPPDQDVFVRPEHDNKAFNGEATTAGAFKAWCQIARVGDLAGVDASTPIVVGTPYGISAEWRLFVCEGRVQGASQYRSRGRLSKVQGAPDEVLDFARKAIALWDPAPVYVLDVCLSAGNPYIVEAQGFNSAGHYAADLVPVIAAANECAKRLWLQSRPRLAPKP
jgi:hypothetical protein